MQLYVRVQGGGEGIVIVLMVGYGTTWNGWVVVVQYGTGARRRAGGRMRMGKDEDGEGWVMNVEQEAET